MERDMTAGIPGKIILNFTIPIFIGNMFQQIYNMADTIIVGKFVGNAALAAVGSCGTLMFLILGFLMGLTAGFTVVTAQHYGAGNMKAMRQSVASAAILSAAVSLLMTVGSMAMMRHILHWMNTPADMYDQAYSYIMVICGGIAAQVLYNLLASVLRALGDSKRPLYFLILAALLNIALDLVFIIVFHMGAAGAAYATVISQGISGLLCLWYIAKKSSGTASSQRRLEYELESCKMADENRSSDGVSIFNYCNRNHCRAVGAQCAWVSCGGRFFRCK